MKNISKSFTYYYCGQLWWGYLIKRINITCYLGVSWLRTFSCEPLICWLYLRLSFHLFSPLPLWIARNGNQMNSYFSKWSCQLRQLMTGSLYLFQWTAYPAPSIVKPGGPTGTLHEYRVWGQFFHPLTRFLPWVTLAIIPRVICPVCSTAQFLRWVCLEPSYFCWGGQHWPLCVPQAGLT